MGNNDKPEKTKVCTIFEPTYRSIATLPTDSMKLRMFLALCNYAFDEHEPEFGSETEERILAALWEQFRLVFVQSAKRAKINAMNGAKGGRPKKTDETDGFSEENPEKPTETPTYTSTEGTKTALCYLDSDFVYDRLDELLGFESRAVFSEDLGLSVLKLAKEMNMNEDDLSSYIAYVVEYVDNKHPDERLNYLYSVLTKREMYGSFIEHRN